MKLEISPELLAKILKVKIESPFECELSDDTGTLSGCCTIFRSGTVVFSFINNSKQIGLIELKDYDIIDLISNDSHMGFKVCKQ